MKVELADGVELAYDDTGSGAPLLFIHGWPHTRQLWTGQASGLARHARCIAPDLRGFGASTGLPTRSIERHADDVAALMTALDIGEAVVCGLSMGGYVAMELLRRHRTMVRALILCDTRATADGNEAREKRMRLAEFIEERGMEALAELQVAAQVSAATMSVQPEVTDALRRLMAGTPASGAVDAQHAMAARADSTDVLAAASIPVLIVGGSDDTITPPAELRAMAAEIPGARIELIEGAGHLCPYERPAAFNHVVGEFVGGLQVN